MPQTSAHLLGGEPGTPGSMWTSGPSTTVTRLQTSTVPPPHAVAPDLPALRPSVRERAQGSDQHLSRRRITSNCSRCRRR